MSFNTSSMKIQVQWSESWVPSLALVSEPCTVPWPLWLTSLAVITLLMTVWRKSFSPATLGEKREMFSCLWRMASSNASLQYAHNGQTPQRRRDGGRGRTRGKSRWRRKRGRRRRRRRRRRSGAGEPQSDGCEEGSGMRERERERERETHTPKSDANTVTDTKPLVSS